MPSATDRPADHRPYVFVSYASADRARIGPLVDALTRAGVAAWIDRQGIGGGENYGTVIADAVKGSAAIVLMASAASLSSRNVKQEIALGWRFERPYLPLLLEEVTIPDDLAYWLEAAQWIEVVDKGEGAWLPQVLAALAPFGITPATAAYEAETLAGREREQTLLREKLDTAREGKGGLVLIGGEAGVGKTTLAEAALHEAAARGCTVLEGHCFDLADTPPYGPWIDLFAHYQPSLSSPPLPPAFAARGTVGVVVSQIALFVAVEDFLKALSIRQPIVLLLDDLHWSDPASLDLLRYLARSVAGMPMLILVTYRSDELTRRHPLYALLPQLAREAGAGRIDLSRLDDDAVRHLAAERYGLPDADANRLTTYLQGRAEGNALFVGELLRSLEEAGTLRATGGGWALGDLTATTVPVLLQQVIDGRLGRLDEGAQRLLAVASVIGHEVPLDVWATVAEADEETLLDLTERAEEANLLLGTADGTGVRFAHALIREALYEGIPSTRRRRLHLRAGEVLAEAGNPALDAVAMHFQRAGDRRAVPWLVKAGERAQLAYARSTAIERYEAALALLEAGGGDLGERGWLRYRIARLRRFTSPEQGVECADEALSSAAVVGDAALAAAARYTRGLCLFYTDQVGMAIPDMAAGCAALEALPPDELARLDLGPDAQGIPTVTNPRGFLVAVLAGCGRIGEAIAMGEAMREGVPRHTPLGELGWAHHGDRDGGLGSAYALAGRPDEAREAFARARAALEAVGNFHTLGSATYIELHLLSLPYRADRPEELRQMADGAESAWRRAGALLTSHIPVLALSGQWPEARAEAADALQPGRGGVARLLGISVLAELARRQGEPGTAWALIRTQLPQGQRTALGSRSFWSSQALIQLAIALHLDAAEDVQAREWLEAHDRWLVWSGAVRGQSEGQALWAQYHRQAGDSQQAYAHTERALAHATEPRQPLALLAAHRLLGELDADAGRYEDAATHLETSLALADACQAPYERALTLLAMAELRAAQGASDDAKRLLDAVRTICAPLGAKPALARADGLVARLAGG